MDSSPDTPPDTPPDTRTPRLAASVILLRDAPSGLEVLLLKRHTRSEVHGGVHVFPGGKVEDNDGALAHPAGPAACAAMGLTEPEAAAILGAAIRELDEECGIRLSGAAALRPYSRWITPVKSLSPKRFDTWFFAAALPEGAEARPDNFEAVEVRWTRPRDALQDYWSGAIQLAPPQIMILAALLKFENTQALFERDAAAPISTICPEHLAVEAQRMIVFPGDPLHSVQSVPALWGGPQRLLFRAGRLEPPNGLDDLLVASTS